jgi:predicted RND superfamily exporter protein
MAICLIKAIMFAILSVFFFMPGLLVLFGDLMKKTQHRSLIPNMSFIGKFAYKTRKVVPIIFAVVVVGAMFVSSACPFSYAYSDQKTTKENQQSMAKRLIDENFGSSNMLAVIVPSGDYEAEAELLGKLAEYPQVKSAMGLANTEAMDGYTLADRLTPRQFSELAGIDYELAGVVYAAYAAENQDYGEIINDISSYGVPLIDIFLFVSQQIDSGLVSLEGEQAEMLAEASLLMKSAKELLVGENYDRMLLYLNLPTEGEEAFAFLDEIRAVASNYYPAEDIHLAGNLTSSEDFMLSFEIDNVVVTVVSIIIVLIVLLFAFKSVAMPIILILVIQGAIWINFSVPALMKTPLFFLGYLIITAIQMGANIDYAIVIGTRFNEMKRKLSPREAIIDTMSFAFPTVITSGSIMSIAGFLIGYMSSVPIISSMGINLARGTIVSIILVLFVLPQLLLITSKLVDKTSFTLATNKKSTSAYGKKIRISGMVSGEINGTVNGVIDAVIDGNVNLTLHTGDINQEKEDCTCEK